MKQEKRWILLQHTGDPNDPQGIHFDLLLEDNDGCRSWRLLKMPIPDGSAVKATLAPLHKLEWLERDNSEVSQGRGWAHRLIGGVYKGNLPVSNEAPISIELHSATSVMRLEIENGFCWFRSMQKKVCDS